MDKDHKFFGSKLNSVLLLVLIILMIFALHFMYQNKEVYLPKAEENKEENTNEKIYEQASELVNHNYTNLRLGFYLDVNGLKPSAVNYDSYTNIHFTEMNKNINEPNGLNVQVFDTIQWKKYQPDMQIKTYVDDLVYNGITYNHYTQPSVDPGINDPKFIDFYVTSNYGMYYVINSSNIDYLSKFGFLPKMN